MRSFVLFVTVLLSVVSTAGAQEKFKNEKTVDQLIQALHSRDPIQRADACHGIYLLGPKAKAALPGLTEALLDSNKDVRVSAASAIGAIGSEAATAVPNLIKACEDQDEDVRCHAAMNIGKFGSNAKSAVSMLIKLLQDKNKQVRIHAAISLGEIGKDAKPAVPALIELLKGPEGEVRSYVAYTLGDIGEEVQSAIPALAQALKSETGRSRRFGSMAFYATPDEHRAIGRSLVQFGKPAVPALTEMLQHSNPDVRWTALFALGELGAKAQTSVEAICKLLDDNDDGVCTIAVRTLVKVEAAPTRAIPLLTESLKHKNGLVRLAAAEGLGHFGPKAKSAIPSLVKVYHARDIMVGGSLSTIGEAIKKIDPEVARKEGIE